MAPRSILPKRRGGNARNNRINFHGDHEGIPCVDIRSRPQRIRFHPFYSQQKNRQEKHSVKYLGKDFVVKASVGHIRDLPRSAADIPERYKTKEWSDLGVDVKNDFTPLYVIPSEKKDQVRQLKTALKNADVLYLATDEDREGESISWHLVEVLKPKVPVYRLVFHEITKGAIERSLDNLREINLSLVQAQETRRIVDRLYGYKVSPLLWDKLRKRNLSAGRVQSVALRLVVDRERERRRFISSDWWSIHATLSADVGTVETKLISWQSLPIAEGNAFNAKGELTKKATVLDEKSCGEIVSKIQDQPATLKSLTTRKFTEKPAPPFITSTLQQEAVRKLRWTTKRTMSVAQRLYESGWITYMRTDSTVLSTEAIRASRDLIADHYGVEFLPSEPRLYRSSAKNAQEAHEAIRPAGDVFRTPQEAENELNVEQAKLYELIWKRTVASQMNNATGQRVRAVFSVDAAELVATGKSYLFQGFRRAYVEGDDNPEQTLKDKEKLLPPLKEGDVLTIAKCASAGHSTAPPARLTEASLVRVLEERGIGRPSTYASIIDNILSRGYIFKKGSALVPTFTAFMVIDLLEQHLSWLVDYDFTAKMESRLDDIASGSSERLGVLNKFFLGDAGLMSTLSVAYDTIERDQCALLLGESPEGEPIEVRCGRHGAYVQTGDIIAFIPGETPPDELDVATALELIEEKKKGPKVLGDDPESNKAVTLRKGPYGHYIQLGEPEEVPKKRGKGMKTIKPKQVSLLRGMKPEEIGLDVALKLLSLPRNLGPLVRKDETNDVVAANGRFGPYIRWGKETRSIPATISILDLTLAQAEELLAQEKSRRSGTLKVLGAHKKDGKEISLKQGRYGVYVTNGEVNASVPKSIQVDELTLDQAIEMIDNKLAAGPKKKTTRTRRKKKS